MNLALNWQAWRKLLTSLFWGMGGPSSWMVLILLGSADIPDVLNTVPNHDTEIAPKVYFSRCSVSPLPCRRVRHLSKFSSCFSGVLSQTRYCHGLMCNREAHGIGIGQGLVTLQKLRPWIYVGLHVSGRLILPVAPLLGWFGDTHGPCPSQKTWLHLWVCDGFLWWCLHVAWCGAKHGGLSYVIVYSDLARLFLFCDDHIWNPWGVFLWFDIFNFVSFPELFQMST